MNNQLWLVDR